jgi:hypothetical protein
VRSGWATGPTGRQGDPSRLIGYRPWMREPVEVSPNAASQAAPRSLQLVGTTVLGLGLVTAGMLSAYLTLATPLVGMLVPASRASDGLVLGLGAWSFALMFGGALLVSGTSRLALMLAVLRRRGPSGGPAARALAGAADEVVLRNAVIPIDHVTVPELVVGPFGVAVVHELQPSNRVRQVRGAWEVRVGDSWQQLADPLEAAARDGERVRRWFAATELDFVVRVAAALVVTDRQVARTPTCAVVAPHQIESWLASLPRQRTLTAGRRGRLVSLIQAAAARPVPVHRIGAGRGARTRTWNQRDISPPL